MVLTDRQRHELHVGIFEYLKSREGDAFQQAADALAQADPDVIAAQDSSKGTQAVMAGSTILEKKWTAIPRLQKKVLELERAVAHNTKIHAHRMLDTSGDGATSGSTQRRMLPRLPATHTLQGHSEVVLTVQVHPVFTVVVSGSEDGTIKVWDHESGEYVRTLKGHTNSVTGLDFNPSGSLLASSSTDLSMKLWDFSNYTCIRTLRGHDHTISATKFLPNLGPSSANSNEFLLSASRDKTVKVWEVATGFCDQTLSDHFDWVRCLAIRQHDGGVFATAGNDTVILLYDTVTRKKIAELRGHEHVIESIAFLCESPASQSNGTVKSSAASKHLETARTYLASGGRDRSVRLWSIASQTCLHQFQVHENWVRSVLIHPSGNFIIAAGDDRSIRVLDISSKRCLRHLEDAHPHFVTSLSMHPTLPILVSGSVDTTVKCWMLD